MYYRSPDQQLSAFWQAGWDVTKGDSSLYVVDTPEDARDLVPVKARKMMSETLFLPVYPGLSETELESLGGLVRGLASK
jgi:hypothetical protein